MNRKINKIIRWIARVLAALMAAFMLVMGLGNILTDGLGPLLEMSLWESLMMAAFVVVFLGLVLGWFRERAGGWLAVGGMVVFYLFDYAFSGTFPRGVFFPLIALPGFLYLFAWYASRQASAIE